jgi:shikimate 5-dehydrogenase/shikimate kinase
VPCERRPGPLHVVTAAPPAVFVPRDLAALPAVADLVELRLDLLPGDVEVETWVAASPRPVLATVRSRAQGGAFRGPPREAAALLVRAARAGAAWLDVEASAAPLLGTLPEGTRLLASQHGSEGGAPAWARERADVHGIKLARPVRAPRALVAALAEARAAPPGTFVVPYERAAEVRSVTLGATGLLFGSADAASAAAPGQPRLQDLLDEMRAGEVSTHAALYGLVGAPPSRSPSPALHNAVFRAAGRDALYVPLAGFELEEALGLPLAGMSVTMPAKATAARYADRLGPRAAATGVANTLVRAPEGWLGLNTDAEALVTCLSEARPGATAFVLGAGGYARAATWALRERGYGVRVGARTEARAVRLAQAFDVAPAGLPYERRPSDAVVVNATPAGADGREAAAFVGASLRGLEVLDAPYARAGASTGLVAQARADGAARVVDGRTLLAAQAAGQARAFAAPQGAPEGLERILALALDPPADLVLLGTRGAGKTTVGRLVARALGRPFVDLDEDVARVTGRSAAAWIRAEGWARFRDLEADLLRRALGRRGAVLAPGGGVVEHEAARDALAAAPCTVWLDVPPEVAAARLAADAGDRPRVEGAADVAEEARLLVARRTPHWRALARHVARAEGEPHAVAADVAAWWCEHQPTL